MIRMHLVTKLSLIHALYVQEIYFLENGIESVFKKFTYKNMTEDPSQIGSRKRIS